MGQAATLGSTGEPKNKARAATAVMVVVTTLLSLWFLRKYAIHYLTDWSDESLGRYVGRAGWIRLHMIGGIPALLIGAYQLWTGRERDARPRHRWFGRAYLLAILIGGIAALGLAATTNGDRAWQLALLGLWAAWWTTTGMAWWAIRTGNVAQHREWMFRSYGVTLGFTLDRLFYEFPIILQLASPTLVPNAFDTALLWLCFVPTLIGLEVWIQGRKIWAARRGPVRAIQPG